MLLRICCNYEEVCFLHVQFEGIIEGKQTNKQKATTVLSAIDHHLVSIFGPSFRVGTPSGNIEKCHTLT